MKVVSNDIFFEQVDSLLKEGQCVEITVFGTSMSPFFKTGVDKVRLAPWSPLSGHLRKGDIILFSLNGNIRLHRIIHIWGTLLDIRGDGCYGPYEHATTSDVLGVVVDGSCFSGKPFAVSSFRWRAMSYLWIHTYWIRHQLLRCVRVVKSILH